MSYTTPDELRALADAGDYNTAPQLRAAADRIEALERENAAMKEMEKIRAKADFERARRGDEAMALLRENIECAPFQSYAEWMRSGDAVCAERIHVYDERRDRARAFLSRQEAEG